MLLKQKYKFRFSNKVGTTYILISEKFIFFIMSLLLTFMTSEMFVSLSYYSI